MGRGAAGLKLTADVAAKVDAAAKLPQSETKVALQIVPVSLRVWVVDQDDVVCRPFYSAVLELYPRGKVLGARMHSPASRQPGADALLDFLLDHMLTPPTGEPRQRPTNVSFIDEKVFAAVAPVLSRLRIEGDVLTLADGVADYVRMFSDKLVKMDRASRGDAAEYPGLLSVPGVTPDAALMLMNNAVAMYRDEPWKRIRESIALEVIIPQTSSGSRANSRSVKYFMSVLGSNGTVKGVAIMASLTSLREKYRRSASGARGDRNLGDSSDEEEEEGGPGVATAASGAGTLGKGVGELLCARCGLRVGEDFDPDGSRFVNRCGACKRLLYCDEECQRADWGLRHREECSVAAVDKDYLFHRVEWAWLKRELALLYVDPTSVPFDDLDSAAEHQWPIIDDASPPLHPMAFVTIEGATQGSRKVDRPTSDEVRVLSLLASALTALSALPPGNGAMYLPNGVAVRVAEDLAASAAAPVTTAGSSAAASKSQRA
jgi:MYND finger